MPLNRNILQLLIQLAISWSSAGLFSVFVVVIHHYKEASPFSIVRPKSAGANMICHQTRWSSTFSKPKWFLFKSRISVRSNQRNDRTEKKCWANLVAPINVEIFTVENLWSRINFFVWCNIIYDKSHPYCLYKNVSECIKTRI